MFKKAKYITLVLALAGILAVAETANAEIAFKSESLGKLRVSGFLRVQADLRTGPENPNTSPAFNRNENLQQFRPWGILDLDWDTPVKNLKVFLRTRFISDVTDNVTSGDFDAFPSAGGNAGITRFGGSDGIGELWEARIDYTVGNWWFRVGRQPIVWGDLAPTRLLDTVNSLDLSFHAFNELGGREAFDNIRIPIWAIRGSYTFPFAPEYSIEAFVSPNKFGFIPTQLPAADSPFDIQGLPPFLSLTDKTDDAQSGVAAGIRLLGVAGPVSYTLNWIVRRDGDGVSELASQSLDPSRFGFAPSPPFPPFTFGPFASMLPFGALPGDALGLRIKHPTFHTVGVSANYFHSPSKTVVRLEAVYDINRPFERRTLGPPDFDGSPPFFSVNTPNHIEDDQFGYAIALDRPTFLIRKDRAAMITFQVEQRFRGDPRRGEQRGLLGARADRTETILTFLFSQPFAGFGGRYDEWFTDLTARYDVKNSFFIQPSIRYEPGNHWRTALWYTRFGGDDRRSGKFGSLKFASGVNASISYQF
ncbi:MAG: DUF1302 family protein [Gammaproteobacteria bacterium]